MCNFSHFSHVQQNSCPICAVLHLLYTFLHDKDIKEIYLQNNIILHCINFIKKNEKLVWCQHWRVYLGLAGTVVSILIATIVIGIQLDVVWKVIVQLCFCLLGESIASYSLEC